MLRITFVYVRLNLLPFQVTIRLKLPVSKLRFVLAMYLDDLHHPAVCCNDITTRAPACFLLVSCLASYSSKLKTGGSTSLRNVGTLLSDYTVLHPTR
jgi:hypothetical protein